MKFAGGRQDEVRGRDGQKRTLGGAQPLKTTWGALQVSASSPIEVLSLSSLVEVKRGEERNAQLMRRCSIGMLLLVLALLPISGLRAHQTMRSAHLGKLAYIQSGDVWVKAVPGGQPKRLTTDGGNWRPRWSSSGQWLAVWKYNWQVNRPLKQVWVLRADGGAAYPLHRGAKVADYAWGPTVDRLAYVIHTEEELGELWTANADGSDARPLVTHPVRGNLAWSPDGSWIAYNDAEWGIWKVSPDGSVRSQLYAWGGLTLEKGEVLCKSTALSVARIRRCEEDTAELPRPGVPYPERWAATGSYLLFWQAETSMRSLLSDGVALYAIPAAGGEPRQLAADLLPYSDYLAGSPIKQLLAITWGDGRSTWCNKRIVVVDLPGGKGSNLTDDTVPAFSPTWSPVVAFSPTWSPDGTRIAYVAQDHSCLAMGDEKASAVTQRRIWVMKSDGSDKRQLTHDASYRDERPLWSVDGRHLLFVRIDQSNRVSLWLMRADGRAFTQVVDELSPSPVFNLYHNYYGHIDWNEYVDWWQETVLVTRVMDGTTIEVERQGRRETVRYLSLKPVELYHPRKGVEVLGKELKQASRALVEGKRVRLAFDVEPRDRHGRLLAYVYLPDGTFVNAWLVEHGYAQAMPMSPDMQYQGLLGQLQREAMAAGRGLWGK